MTINQAVPPDTVREIFRKRIDVLKGRKENRSAQR